MIIMMDTPESLEVCEREIGLPCEQMFTPLTRYNAQRPEQEFCMDNGGFSRFNPTGFRKMLRKHEARKHLCRFVALPDVVASARRTLECFDVWYEELEGWKRALVAQDGMEDLDIPWARIDAVFIGGSTKWKLSQAAADVVIAAKICEKWAHVGRINTPGRLEKFQEIGADSGDGSGLAQFTWMRDKIYRAVHEPGLFQVEIDAREASVTRISAEFL